MRTYITVVLNVALIASVAAMVVTGIAAAFGLVSVDVWEWALIALLTFFALHELNERI